MEVGIMPKKPLIVSGMVRSIYDLNHTGDDRHGFPACFELLPDFNSQLIKEVRAELIICDPLLVQVVRICLLDYIFKCDHLCLDSLQKIRKGVKSDRAISTTHSAHQRCNDQPTCQLLARS
jgi:hypothetical protein